LFPQKSTNNEPKARQGMASRLVLSVGCVVVWWILFGLSLFCFVFFCFVFCFVFFLVALVYIVFSMFALGLRYCRGRSEPHWHIDSGERRHHRTKDSD